MIKMWCSSHLNGSLLFANIVGLELLRLWQSSADRRSETDSWVSSAVREVLIEDKTMIPLLFYCSADSLIFICDYITYHSSNFKLKIVSEKLMYFTLQK